jgi:alpha(1,3/1,4) fucosyltransferase
MCLIGTGNRGPVSVGFVGFHQAFNPVWNSITHSVSHRFRLDVTTPEPGPVGHLRRVPNFLFFSVYKDIHRDVRYDRCVKIFTCEENFNPPWEECHYAMTGDHSDDPRHLRLPIYVRAMRHVQDQPCYPRLRDPCPDLVKRSDADWETLVRRKFCNFVVSNELWRDSRCRGECGLALRIKFFERLSKYKSVDSGGKVRNNLGHQVSDKLPFIQDYKFTIAFESASYPGYVSEKLVEPMFVSSIPIYWGCPRINEDFNPASMVLATGRRLEDVVDEVVALDQDDSAYLAKLREPWFHDNVPNKYCPGDYVADFLKRVFAQGTKP